MVIVRGEPRATEPHAGKLVLGIGVHFPHDSGAGVFRVANTAEQDHWRANGLRCDVHCPDSEVHCEIEKWLVLTEFGRIIGLGDDDVSLEESSHNEVRFNQVVTLDGLQVPVSFLYPANIVPAISRPFKLVPLSLKGVV